MDAFDLPWSNPHVEYFDRYLGFIGNLCESVTKTAGQKDKVLWFTYNFSTSSMSINYLADLF